MRCKSFVLILLLVASEVIAASPESVVNQFYKYHFSHDMEFTPESVKARQGWFTPELEEACRIYFALPQQTDEVPVINGDPFTDSQEYPDRFTVGSAKISKSSGRIPVTLVWDVDNHSRKLTVLLKKVKGKWLIDDLEYPDHESLRKLLSPPSP